MNLKFYFKIFFVGLFLFALAVPVLAAAPSGADWFQLITDSITGGDATGDGGTGDADDYNYYYVGQSFTTTIQIKSGGTTAANIWIDYSAASSTASNLLTGSYFNVWSNQTIDSGTGRVYSTGANIPVVQSSGTGTFGYVDWTMDKPTNANYGTSTPAVLDVNIGNIGSTTESNISLAGDDLLDSAEDFNFHIWADTKKPYAKSPSPATASTSVSVSANYLFDLLDSKNGEGDDSGVGTGVNTATVGRVISFNDGSATTSELSNSSFSCSGIWGSNLCATTVNPTTPSGIPGDLRNWAYNTNYTVEVSGFKDFASAAQNQLGDANGPNTMNAKYYTFTTESDTVAPYVAAETPTRSSTGNGVSTNIVIDILDKKSPLVNVSGTGLDSSTCQVNVSSASFALTTFTENSATVATTSISYGARFTINPATNFAQNETVTVSVFDCEDLAGNIMTTDTYTFSTSDDDAPYVDTLAPLDDESIAATDNITFHLKDDGEGVDLTETVIYVDGDYYSLGGGAGQVTITGTKITYATSTDFTAMVAGTANDYTFTINAPTFADGEAVPVIIYSTDLGGNIMERVVYAPVIDGGVGGSGSAFCGPDTSWNGSLCVGTGGGSGGSRGSSGGCRPGYPCDQRPGWIMIDQCPASIPQPIQVVTVTKTVVATSSETCTFLPDTGIVKTPTVTESVGKLSSTSPVTSDKSTLLPLWLIVLLAAGLGYLLRFITAGLLTTSVNAAREKVTVYILIVVVLIVLGWWAVTSGLFSSVWQKDGLTKEITMRWDGGLIDPIDKKPVAGFDVKEGDTAVRTSSSSSKFIFANVSDRSGLTLTHPLLKLPVRIIPNNAKAAYHKDIYVDINLLNKLIVESQFKRGLAATGELTILDQTVAAGAVGFKVLVNNQAVWRYFDYQAGQWISKK